MNGAEAVIDTLLRSGVTTTFGLPGVHALPLFAAQHRSDLRLVGCRTELAAGFAASGYARSTGRPTALIVSTGPGTLISLAAVLEAASSHDPVVVIASQIETGLIGRRRGALHEIPDQLGSILPMVKWAERAQSVEQLAPLTAHAVAEAIRPPSGPTYLELPTDLLRQDAGTRSYSVPRAPAAEPPPDDALTECAAALDEASAPLLWAGAGAVRSGAFEELAALAERIDAPVVTTYMGKGAIAADHPLAAGSACEEAAIQEMITKSDVLLCIGTELGAETTGQWTLELPRTFQIDASAVRIGTTYRTTPIIADARDALGRLTAITSERRRDGARRAATVREAVDLALGRGDRQARSLLHDLREAVPKDTVCSFDMTILGYWAGSDWPADAGRTFLYPLGCGTIGYSLPAALGAAAAGRPTVAVSGDGGAMYGLAELAVMGENQLPVTWVVIDDGGYGVLRHYQVSSGVEPHAVELARPDFAALAKSFGIASVEAEPGGLGDAVAGGVRSGLPNLVSCRVRLDPPPGLV